MWGTDGVRVFTVDDGWGWIFTAVEHWNAECVGWHVCKRGDRFAALQPISMGLAGLYGSTAAGAARGLALRMDHGSQYLSDHFTNQIKFWGIQPSYAFVERAPDQRRRRAVQSHAQGTDHPWPHLPQHRGAAERRPRLRRTLQCPVDRRKERLPEPRSSSSGVARRDLNQARRVRQTCVQGTGCATLPCALELWDFEKQRRTAKTPRGLLPSRRCYDLARNEAWVTVGRDDDTPTFIRAQ